MYYAHIHEHTSATESLTLLHTLSNTRRLKIFSCNSDNKRVNESWSTNKLEAKTKGMKYLTTIKWVYFISKQIQQFTI